MLSDADQRCPRCDTPLCTLVVDGRRLGYEYLAYFDAGQAKPTEKVTLLHTSARCQLAELARGAGIDQWEHDLEPER